MSEQLVFPCEMTHISSMCRAEALLVMNEEEKKEDISENNIVETNIDSFPIEESQKLSIQTDKAYLEQQASQSQESLLSISETNSNASNIENLDLEGDISSSNTSFELSNEDVSWKCKWLKLKVEDLQTQMDQCKQLYQERKNKQPQIIAKQEDSSQNFKPNKSEVFSDCEIMEIEKEPSNNQKPIFTGKPNGHRLLSKYDVNKRDDYTMNGLLPQSPKKKKKHSLSIEIPTSPRFNFRHSPTGTPRRPGRPPKHKKNHSSPKDFDINNFVVPCLSGNVFTPEIKPHSEILLPKWKKIPEAKVEIEDDEEDEDTSDEAFASRHVELEIREIQTRIIPLKKSQKLQNPFDDLPAEIFSPPSTKTQPFSPSQTALSEMKNRYLNSPKFQKDWLVNDLNKYIYGNEKYFLQEDEEFSHLEKCETPSWQIVRSESSNDTTEQNRNVIRLRKITPTGS